MFGQVQFYTNTSHETDALECHYDKKDGLFFRIPIDTYKLFSDQVVPEFINGKHVVSKKIDEYYEQNRVGPVLKNQPDGILSIYTNFTYLCEFHNDIGHIKELLLKNTSYINTDHQTGLLSQSVNDYKIYYNLILNQKL